MKTLVASILLIGLGTSAYAACSRPVDPKKVVLMLAFHEGGEEEKGAIEGACARGELLVMLPTVNPEDIKNRVAEQERLRVQYDGIRERYDACAEAEDLACSSAIEPEFIRAEYAYYDSLDGGAADVTKQLDDFLAQSKANGVKVSSMIISGHDGGGHFYGDTGETTIAEISGLVSQNSEVFSDMGPLLLMGCWTGTPDQVDQWRRVFPSMRVLGGFVGSAPASTRIGAGTYISGLLRGEKSLPRSASRSRVQTMLNQVQNLNIMTAGVFIAPNCVEQDASPSYFYISPATSADEIPESMRTGLANYVSTASMEDQCRATFEYDYDWETVMAYYSGEREPDNTPALRSIYSYLRNNEFCFTSGFVNPEITADQVLFLRFFQDTKKNIGKYLKADLDTMYASLDALVDASTDLEVKAAYRGHKKLNGDSLNGLTRLQTNEEIAKLTRVFDVIAGANSDHASMPQIRSTMTKIDTFLYRLKCIPPTWHEYAESEPLVAPSCTE